MNEVEGSLWVDGSRRMLERIDDTAQRVTEGFPNFADLETGEWETSPQGEWTGGHWGGELWIACKVTGEERYREWATRWCQALRPRVVQHRLPQLPVLLWGRAR